MKRLTVIFLISILVVTSFGQLVHADTSSVIFSRILLGTEENASDESVTIYNNSQSDVDVSGMKLQYKSATGTSWTTRAIISTGVILHSYSPYTFASVQTADAKMSAGLAQTGGNLRLTDGDGNLLDQLAWGAGDSPLGNVVASPPVGVPLLRKPLQSSLALQDSDNNATDFISDGSGSNATTDPVTTGGSSDANSPDLSQVSDQIQLTEIFPDPISPQTDSNDEFIELYNASHSDVLLKGWQLKDSGGKAYIFGDVTLQANSYLAVFSKQSHISLNNNGDTITLYNGQGDQLDQSPNYEKAHPGLSWGLTEDGWAWTVRPTPGGVNTSAINFPVDTVSASTKNKTSKAKTKSVAVKKAKSSKIAGNKSSDPQSTEDTAATKQVYNIWAWLLIAAGVGTIGYGIYEYRSEIKATYLRLRSAWRPGRKSRA